jgi:hypothetical protein
MICDAETQLSGSTARMGNEAKSKTNQIGALSNEVQNEEKRLERALMMERDATEKYENAKRYERRLVDHITLPRGKH